MIVEDVRLDRIDHHNETCRISEDLDPPQLENSLREIGQVNPAVLVDRNSGGLMIVCGFRRLRALRRMGRPSALARILPEGDLSLLQAFRLALWENLSHRRLSPLEAARALFALRHTCGLPEGSLLETYMPALDLPPHPRVLHTYLGLHLLHPHLRAQFSEGHLALATVERLASRPTTLQQAFAGIMAGVRLTVSLQRQVLDLVDELAALTACPAEEVLRHAEIIEISADAGLSPQERGQKLYDLLYRQRFPRITAAEDRFFAATSEIDLPGDVHLHHDRYFETTSIRVEFQAASVSRFRTLAGALDKAARSPKLETLFQISQAPL
jgi:hypothetical protein